MVWEQYKISWQIQKAIVILTGNGKETYLTKKIPSKEHINIRSKILIELTCQLRFWETVRPIMSAVISGKTISFSSSNSESPTIMKTTKIVKAHFIKVCFIEKVYSVEALGVKVDFEGKASLKVFFGFVFIGSSFL